MAEQQGPWSGGVPGAQPESQQTIPSAHKLNRRWKRRAAIPGTGNRPRSGRQDARSRESEATNRKIRPRGKGRRSSEHKIGTSRSPLGGDVTPEATRGGAVAGTVCLSVAERPGLGAGKPAAETSQGGGSQLGLTLNRDPRRVGPLLFKQGTHTW